MNKLHTFLSRQYTILQGPFGAWYWVPSQLVRVFKKDRGFLKSKEEADGDALQVFDANFGKFRTSDKDKPPHFVKSQK